MIASIEGLASAPAFRGVALAVFEDLQLAEFGNRIPMMTFEVIADEEPPTIGSILGDASGGVIISDAADTVTGYAAYGRSIRDAVEPLAECFGVELLNDGKNLRSPSDLTPLAVTLEELGSSAEAKHAARIEREQAPPRELPSRVRLAYYDRNRDYQTGEAQAFAAEGPGPENPRDLPAVLSAGDAKAIAHAMIARAWACRDKLTLRLPPSRLSLEPGARIELGLSPPQWRVEKTTLDGFVTIAELRPSIGGGSAVAGDSGRSIENRDVVAQPLSLALLDLPSGLGPISNEPTVWVAATSAAGWRRHPIAISFGGQTITVEPARVKAVIGRAEGMLPPAATELIDEQNDVIVALIDDDQWLTSCDDDALTAGGNLAILGSELIQFGNATALGGGRFQLSRLLRGRGGSEWATTTHSAEEQFCLIRSDTLRPVALPNWSVGATITATPSGGGATALQFVGENVRPPAPVNLVAERGSDGELQLSWTRRSRQGVAWLDGTDAPIGEAIERYRVNVSSASRSVELLASEPSLTITAADMAALGSGPATIEVRQLGDLAASRPALITVTL